MKNVKAMFAAITLGLILSSATLAGDVATPGYVPPPPPSTAAPLQEDQADAADVDSSSFAIDILIAALGAYY
ncbi:MAG: hypothetical protein M3447_05225 [Acidobacteriota bacterium]|nr:hypothetical protein [Acidobacteriota bacterium]